MSGSGTAVRYVPSKFVSLSHEDDGSMMLHSSRTGAVGVVPPPDVPRARAALLPRARTEAPEIEGILSDLVEGGFLVSEAFDEDYAATDAHVRRYTGRGLHLIVMPTEQCNFRCVYCYESFKRGGMTPEVETGIVNLVKRTDPLERLTLSWFGGEPLLEREIVLRLTETLAAHSATKDIDFMCSATTNGFFLEPDYADQVIPAGLRTFQITLDGVQEDHDQRRKAADGGPTFDRIWQNLLYLHESDLDFWVSLRHNFDPANHANLDAFLDLLQPVLGSDERFALELQPIGRWGGPNDGGIAVCEGRQIIDTLFAAKRKAVMLGFKDSIALRLMQPNGSVCYAADPRSFVIGPDGQLYKCTVELDYHDRNMVGRLLPDGTLDVDWSKLALWTETDGLDPGTKCAPCYFRGACHGAVCPKEWLDQSDVGCPPVKHAIKDQLQLIKAESLFVRPGAPA